MDGVNLMGLVDLLGVYPPLLGEYSPSLALADYWSHLVLGFTPLPGVRQILRKTQKPTRESSKR